MCGGLSLVGASVLLASLVGASVLLASQVRVGVLRASESSSQVRVSVLHWQASLVRVGVLRASLVGVLLAAI